MFGSIQHFNQHYYATPIQKGEDPDAIRELKTKIYPFILRRLKKEVKCDPLRSIGAHMAFQLSKEDQELINLVAKDPVLKNPAIKAEGLIIIVMKNNLAKFKNRLKEFGYLLE